MISRETQDIEYLRWAVGMLGRSFENKYPDIAKSLEETRDCILIYDRMLLDFFAHPPQNKQEVAIFMNKHLAALLSFSPLVQKNLREYLLGILKFFRDGPEVEIFIKEPPMRKIFYLDDHLLLSRNFLAVYIDDPIKSEEYFRHYLQKTN